MGILTNMKRVILATLLLAFLSPVAALAYSYDEIVLMVKAEEKVFGKANYDQSLDQRLEVLENSVVGYKLDGSDSYRLRTICKKLGLDKVEGAVMAAPVSVEFTPAPKGGMPSVAPDYAAKADEPGPAPSFRSDETAAASEEPVSKSHRLASLTHAKSANSESRLPVSNIAAVIKPRAAAPKVAVTPSLLAKPKTASKAVMHSPNTDIAPAVTDASVAAMTPAVTSSADLDNGGLIAVAVGVASIIGGLSLFFFIRGKEETVSISRCRAYARELAPAVETEALEWQPSYAGVPVSKDVLDISDEQFICTKRSTRKSRAAKVESVEALEPVAPAAPIAQITSVEMSHGNEGAAVSVMIIPSFVPIAEGAVLNESGDSLEPNSDDSFVSDDDFDMDDYVHLLPEHHDDQEKEAEVEAQGNEQAETYIDLDSPVHSERSEVISEESLSFLNSLTADQVGLLLEEFVPSVIALESMNEFHLLNASILDDESKLLVEEKEPITFDCSGEINDNSVPSVWPEYHPEVAPRIYTVSTFVKEALKDASELIGCTAVERERENMQVETEEEGYRALAQLLIEAATSSAAPLPPVVHVPAALPLGTRTLTVAQSAGRPATADYESNLRSLFSEKF